jgi:hypothetical protein
VIWTADATGRTSNQFSPTRYRGLRPNAFRRELHSSSDIRGATCASLHSGVVRTLDCDNAKQIVTKSRAPLRCEAFQANHQEFNLGYLRQTKDEFLLWS